MVYPNITLTPKGLRWFSSGHPWIYASDLCGVLPLQAGVVSVVAPRGAFLAQALFSPHSKIALRVLSREKETIDKGFFERRLKKAFALRERLKISSDAMRLIFSEADGLPSLIVDRYGDYLVFQTLSAGIEIFKSDLVDLLQKLLEPQGILERNDAPVRDLERLPKIVEVVKGEVPTVIVVQEGDLTFAVDAWKGQKTGAFLDQRDNRLLAGKLAFGQALDVFSYHGWSACHMAKKAEHVLCVESSTEACHWILENAKRNNLVEKIEVIQANAFDWLSEQDRAGKRFDLVHLDPPAFVKKPSALEGALRGYKEINLRSLRMLRNSGLLVTSSCSQAMTTDLFEAVLGDAALDAKLPVKIFHRGTQAADHPSLPNFPESNYLKTFFAWVG